MRNTLTMTISRRLLFLSGVIILASCVPEAPHGNPLDPFFNTHSTIEIEGQVYHKTGVNNPIANCQILLKPAGLITTSDQSGHFFFSGIPVGEINLIVSKTGYQPDSIRVHSDSLLARTLYFYLNGLPGVKNIHFYSQFIDQWWPDPYYSVNLDLTVEDPDGISDIKEIRLEIPDLNINRIIEASVRPDSFSLQLKESDLMSGNIFDIIGKPTYIQITDYSLAVSLNGPFFIFRIIETSPSIISPSGLATVNPQPLLTWQEYIAAFQFKFDIQVFYVVAGIPTLLQNKTGIPANQLNYQYPEPLNPGQYYWVVFVRDELHNRSRSKEASFQVP